MNSLKSKLFILIIFFTSNVSAKEYHVSVKGNDKNAGIVLKPFRTINFAAQLAVPGAYVHNLWCRSFSIWPNLVNRLTPYFKPHSVDIIGNSAVDHQDERHYNNIFKNRKPSVVNTEDVVSDDKYNELFADNLGLCVYDQYEYLIQAEGNVYLPGSRPFKHEKNYLQIEHFNPQIKLLEKDNGWWLEMNVDPAWQEKCSYPVITSKLLGKANISSATFETRDKSPYLINTDYSGKKRDANNPFPGPFEINKAGKQTINVWPNYYAKQNN